MRISDWSSDVCSSDLRPDAGRRAGSGARAGPIDDARHIELIGQVLADQGDLPIVVLGTEADAGIERRVAVLPGQRITETRGQIRVAVADIGVEADLAEIGRASCRERVCQYV